MPAAAHFRSEDCRGLASVKDKRGRNIGGWYDTITDVGVERASSTTAGVRLHICSPNQEWLLAAQVGLELNGKQYPFGIFAWEWGLEQQPHL